jgi:hypothetical protein
MKLGHISLSPKKHVCSECPEKFHEYDSLVSHVRKSHHGPPSCDAIIVVRSLSRKVTDIIIFRKKKQGRWIFANIGSVVE